MNKFIKSFSLSGIITLVFYSPLIKLYHYIEHTNIGGSEFEEEECI